MNDAFNENALLGLPALSPARAAFLGHVARHEANLIAHGFYPQEPKTIQTPFGIGTIGPYQLTGVRAMVEGSKPIIWLGYNSPFGNLEKLEIAALMPLVDCGILGLLKFTKMQTHIVGEPKVIFHYGLFYQPDQEAAAHELRTILSINNDNKFTAAENTRIGQLLGYSRADIAAFHINSRQLGNQCTPADKKHIASLGL